MDPEAFFILLTEDFLQFVLGVGGNGRIPLLVDTGNWADITVTSSDAANVDNSNVYSVLTVPDAGGFTITDNSAPGSSAYYRLRSAP